LTTGDLSTVSQAKRTNNMNRLRRNRIAISLAALLTVVLSVTAFTKRDEEDYYYRLNRGLELFGQVFREVSQSYVDRVDPDEFIAAGISGMLKTLDPYTVYLRRRESADIDLLTSGSYGGIGITVGLRDSVVTITDVIDGYSAQREGVRIGDRILQIDGATVLRLPLDSLREYTRGEANSTLHMRILRDGIEAPLDFVLTRDNIKVRSIGYAGMLDGGIGYIRLDRFNATAGDELRASIVDLKSQGMRNGLVLDLRDNPGGILESAVDVCSKFLPSGSTVVTTRGRDSGEERVYQSNETPIADGLPLVVMVNGGTASAAEIVAGAVQDLDAGIIVGTPTYGKGLVQSVRRLSRDATLKLTTARYFTPSGRCIQKIDYGHLRGTSSFFKDSLAYHTHNGRLVYQGGGIRPDTLVADADTTTIVERLRASSAFFNFATRFASSLHTIPDRFAVDDRVLKQFELYALEHMAQTDRTTAVGRARELESVARTEGLSKEMVARISALRADLMSQEQTQFNASRESIRRELALEIANRFRGQHDRQAAMVADDPQIRSALQILRDGQTLYARLLSVR
jgi:carboxyl-terminal processing protease